MGEGLGPEDGATPLLDARDQLALRLGVELHGSSGKRPSSEVRFDAGLETLTLPGVQHGRGQREGGHDHHVVGVGEEGRRQVGERGVGVL